jgi:peptide/nickel transport system substrate-binding protein
MMQIVRRFVPVAGAVVALATTCAFTTGSQVSGAAPQRGGTITFARAFEPVTFDPLKTNGDNGSLWDMVQIYDELVEYQPGSLDPGPGLAASWKVAKDGLTYTFTLRKAQFSNGAPVTSVDVKFSLDRFIDPKTNAGFAFLAESIKSVAAPSANTVVIHMKHTDAELLAALAVPVAAIYPKATFQKIGDKGLSTNPVGSGPFMLKSWTRGKSVELVRNPHYWQKGLPYLDAVHIPYAPDDTTRMLQVQSGQADVAEAVPFSQVSQLDSASGVNVQVEPIAAYDAIWLNHSYGPLGDRNVRQALAYALDLKGIDRAIYADKATVANSTIAQTKYWSASVPAYSFDLAKAKSLMASSKYPKGFKLSFSVPAGDSVHKNVALVAKQAWAKIGVTVSVTSVDSGSLFTDFSKGKFQASIPLPVITSDVLVPDELALAWLQWTPGYQAFFTQYKSAAIKKLVVQANAATSNTTRASLWTKIQTQSMTDAPWIPLFFVPARTAVRDRVQNLRTLRSGWWDLAHTWVKSS